MYATTSALVLQRIRYAESDLIVTLYTKAYGKQTYRLPHVLKSKKGQLRAAFFQPLTLLEVEVTHRASGGFERLRDVRITQAYHQVYRDPHKSALVFFLAELMQRIIREEEANPELYLFLETSMRWLDAQHGSCSNFHIVFMLQLSRYLGCYPDIREFDSGSDLVFFDLLEGRFYAAAQSVYARSGQAVDQLRQFLGQDYESGQHLPMSGASRTALLELLFDYFAVHLIGFNRPKSFAVLQELYQ